MARVQAKPTVSLGAYDLYLRGLSAIYRSTREANKEALTSFYKAIKLVPTLLQHMTPPLGATRNESQIVGW